VFSWSCLASSRLWRAKASKGDSSGGASPAMCKRGDRKGLELVELVVWVVLVVLDRKSNMLGRDAAMMPGYYYSADGDVPIQAPK
jgi:hypothetical protein